MGPILEVKSDQKKNVKSNDKRPNIKNAKKHIRIQFKLGKCMTRCFLLAQVSSQCPMVNSGKKLFKCDQCSYLSTRAWNLKQYKLSHTRALQMWSVQLFIQAHEMVILKDTFGPIPKKTVQV